MSECSFLYITDLVRHKILSYLSPDGLLKLREVCKRTQTWIKESPKDFKKWKNFEIRIEENGFKSLESLLKNKFQISSIYISNESVDFYKNPLIPEFLQEYGHHVTHLKIRKYFTCESFEETQFFEGFPNLQSLELELIDLKNRSKRLNNSPAQFPKIFRNLKVLKLGEVFLLPPTPFFHGTVLVLKIPSTPCTWYLWELIEFCSNLEYLKHPKLPKMLDDNGHDFEGYASISEYVQARGKDNPQSDNLKYYDMDNFSHDHDEDEFGACIFKSKLPIFLAHGTKLLNVDARLFGRLSLANPNRLGRRHTFNFVLSLKNIKPGVQPHVYNNLEKIFVKTSESFINAGWLDMEWPVLKRMEVDFDFENSETEGRGLFNNLVYYLMRERPTVEDLVIKFHSNEMRRRVISPAVISASRIIENFPNLKKLKIVGWDKKNAAYARVWEELESLEELWIEDCKTLGNVGFIGADQDDPTFLKLTKLKKLTLAKLDLMPKITDRVFQDVFSHMNLQEFCLMSDSPVEKITTDGISFLFKGQFYKSITKFPLNTWSSSKISPEVFKELGNKFRIIR